MPMRPGTAEYLGDGVYAEFDGYAVSVDLRGEGRPEKIVFEPEVFEALKRFGDKAFVAETDATEEPQLKIAVFGEHTAMCGRICRDPDERNPDDLQFFEGTKAELLEIADALNKHTTAYSVRVANAIRRECE